MRRYVLSPVGLSAHEANGRSYPNSTDKAVAVANSVKTIGGFWAVQNQPRGADMPRSLTAVLDCTRSLTLRERVISVASNAFGTLPLQPIVLNVSLPNVAL